MTVEIAGKDLTLDQVVAVARGGDHVALTEEALDAMTQASSLAERVFERGLPAYGLTTGLGAQKRTSLHRDDDTFGRRQIEESHVGQGPDAPPDVVRATMLVLANQFAGGSTCVRPVLAERLVQALNEGESPPVKLLGSLGASDLAPMADLARGVLGEAPLAPGEGLALINSSAFGTALAALALADMARLLDAADVAAALALEGFAANLSTLDPAVARARPDPVLARTLERFRDLLEGSRLWAEGVARNLQDPLTFRSTLPIQAAGRVALDHALDRLAIELNAAQGNPLVSVQEGRIFSASVYEVLALSAALDYARTALMSVLSSASERSVKLLDTPWSGLPTGLLSKGGPDLGLSIHAITAQSLAAEASLLAQPASFLVMSTSGAEGIEDRASHLALSARRLSEMVALGEGIVAIELLVSAQAVDLRDARPLGKVTGEAHGRIRASIPALVAGDPPPTDVTPILALLRSGVIR
ncbi:MAG TPA: aromatic amino acid lyase [Thermoleophilia bacterium]|nr:aromatic amino acid lyase [Thermoleophilia bacterium]